MSFPPDPPAPSPPASTEAVPQERPTVTVHLQNIPLLSGLDSGTLTRVGSAMQFRTVEKGNYVLHKGSLGEHLLFLLSGRLQVVDLTEDGREIGLAFLSPGDYFGELSIIDGETRSASVIASESSLLAFLPRTQALELIYGTPLIAERVLKRMAAKIRQATNARTILSIPNAFQRVFALLNQLAKVAPGGLVVIENIPTQEKMAIMINTSRETVSRAIQMIIKNGIVEKDLRRLIVRQPQTLIKMASEPPQQPTD